MSEGAILLTISENPKSASVGYIDNASYAGWKMILINDDHLSFPVLQFSRQT